MKSSKKRRAKPIKIIWETVGTKEEQQAALGEVFDFIFSKVEEKIKEEAKNDFKKTFRKI